LRLQGWSVDQVHRAGHALDDERHGAAGVGGRQLRVRRWVGRVVGDELAGRIAIQPLDLRGSVALRVERGAERRVGGVRVAGVRRDLRTGEDRPTDRVVGDRDALARAVGASDRERAGAELQATEKSFEAAVRTDRERARDVDTVHVHAHAGGVTQASRDERIAARDQIGSVRDDFERLNRARGGDAAARQERADERRPQQPLAHHSLSLAGNRLPETRARGYSCDANSATRQYQGV
jgi:hypothetical protein